MAVSDIVVLGSPVYWCNVTSVGKKFMDRMLPFFRMGKMGPVRKEEKPSKVVLVTTCGVPFPISHIFGVVPGCLKAMKWPFGRMQAKVSTIYCAGMVDTGKSRPSARTLAKARKLGKKL
jgi:putative NADPH-quinone reductase